MKTEDIILRVSDGFKAAKKEKAVEVYHDILPLLEDGSLPLKSHYAFGWITYYAIHQADDANILDRKLMLATYLRLSIFKPHKLHSMILVEAIRLYKNAKDTAFNKKGKDLPKFSIVRFCDLWNLANLRPGDWRRHEYEGHTTSSTVEKLITVYADELEQSSTPPSSGFIAVIGKALEEFPDSASLLSQRAALHVLSGEKEMARDLLRKALILAPGKFYLWSRLASLVDPKDDIRLHVALLYKALASPGQDQFKGRVRLAAAEAWLAREMYAEAKWELNLVKNIYEANGWSLPAAYRKGMKIIPEEVIPVNPERLYLKVAHLADDEVYSSLPEIRVTKTYHKNPDPEKDRRSFGAPAVAWRVTGEDGSNYWLKPRKFGIPDNLPVGTPLLIRLHNGRPVKARLENCE